MKLQGRRFNSPPPLKSCGTGSGPNSVASARSRFVMDTGVANVHAMRRRSSGGAMTRPSNGGGTRSGRCVTGASSARPATRSGWFKANASTIAPPSECLHNQRPPELKLLAETTDDPRLGADRRRRVGRSRRITAAGPIQNDDAEIMPQLSEQRIGKIMHLAGKAVNKQQGRPGPFIEIMDARAVNVDETSARRQLLFHLLR